MLVRQLLADTVPKTVANFRALAARLRRAAHARACAAAPLATAQQC